MLAAADAVADTRKAQGQTNANVAGNIQGRLVLESYADRQRDGAGQQDVHRHGDVGQYRTNGGNDVSHVPPFSLNAFDVRSTKVLRPFYEARACRCFAATGAAVA